MIYLLDTNILIYLIKNQPPGVAQARYRAVDAWSALDTAALRQSQGLVGVELARPFAGRGWLSLGLEHRLGGWAEGHAAHLSWHSRF